MNNIDIEFLLKYIQPVILGICLCAGYTFKKTTDKYHKFIPLGVVVLGIIVSCFSTRTFTAESVLAGMISGLASTGLYEALNNLIFKDKN